MESPRPTARNAPCRRGLWVTLKKLSAKHPCPLKPPMPRFPLQGDIAAPERCSPPGSERQGAAQGRGGPAAASRRAGNRWEGVSIPPGSAGASEQASPCAARTAGSSDPPPGSGEQGRLCVPIALAGPSPRHAFLQRAGLSGLPALGCKGGCAGCCGGLVVGWVWFFGFCGGFFLLFFFYQQPLGVFLSNRSGS